MVANFQKNIIFVLFILNLTFYKSPITLFIWATQLTFLVLFLWTNH